MTPERASQRKNAASLPVYLSWAFSGVTLAEKQMVATISLASSCADGACTELGDLTILKTFVTSLAGHIGTGRTLKDRQSTILVDFLCIAIQGAQMKIESIRIRNFRSIVEMTIPLNNYTCLVGPNGSGKSTILCALNLFFRETENVATDLDQLNHADFHQKKTDDPIEVTLTFIELDQDAQNDFEGYFRQGKLVVSAVAAFDKNSGKAVVKQFGERLGMAAFKEFFKAEGDGAKVADLKELYKAIQQNIDLPAPGTVCQRQAGRACGFQGT